MATASPESVVEMFTKFGRRDVDTISYMTSLPTTYEEAVRKAHRLFRIHRERPIQLVAHSTHLSKRPLLIDPESWSTLYPYLKQIEALPVDEEITIYTIGFTGLRKAYIIPKMTIGQLKIQVADTIGCSPSDLRIGSRDPQTEEWFSDDRRMEDFKKGMKHFHFTIEKISNPDSSSNSAPQAD
ncbi:hypothetical protein CPB86DRAFT_291950 [Serendipita vermifera]|nr:hypothetical protein CPB86DRAFT_291950 [Serendipita vermifera]